MSNSFKDIYEIEFLKPRAYNDFLLFMDEKRHNKEVNYNCYASLPESMEDMIRRSSQELGIVIENRELLTQRQNETEKLNIMKRYLDDCVGQDSTLYITDSYILSDEQAYDTLLILLKHCKAIRIMFIVKKFEHAIFTKLNKDMGQIKKEISVFKSDKFHDRFWFTRKQRGFVIGTSLNGIGNRISLITKLSATDYAQLLSMTEEFIWGKEREENE